MSLTVKVNDPAYDAGAEITVGGISAAFVNGETTVVQDNQISGDIADVHAYLSAVPGFSIVEDSAAAPAAAPQALAQPPVAISTPEGGDQQ